MDLADPELEANNVCCSEWASETHSQIFNPDDFHSSHDRHTGWHDGHIYPALGDPPQEGMIVRIGIG
jgi:hypothetical protein